MLQSSLRDWVRGAAFTVPALKGWAIFIASLEDAAAGGTGRIGRRAGGTPTRAGGDAGATEAAPIRGTRAGGMLAVRENEKARGRDAHASRRGRRRYGGFKRQSPGVRLPVPGPRFRNSELGTGVLFPI
ncbi:MAG: hypothetical protein M5U26_29830 [Planctomycetota bacterium]|nr:hypothetical protein [Planctomycetota bacterium]